MAQGTEIGMFDTLQGNVTESDYPHFQLCLFIGGVVLWDSIIFFQGSREQEFLSQSSGQVEILSPVAHGCTMM